MFRSNYINEYVRLTLDIRWDRQDWTFPQQVESLQKLANRNPKITGSSKKGLKPENIY